ncbi:MAG: hypothetical protein V2I97_01410, partial [Desulfococcaceae bacterium]|nr:hypothetical protein [Desulfococcaceae bacterium]
MKSKLIPKIIRPFSEDFRRIPGKHEFSVLLLLTALGFCGNYFNLELFFGVNFVFGSIAVLLAVRMSGMLWGGLAGLAVGAYTWVLWLHPYAMIVFGLEAFWVGYFQGFFQDRFRQKEKENLILTVLWFWILMGMWLTAFLYRHMLGMPPVQVELIALKQTVNSLFNAAIARIIIQMIPKGRLSRIFFRKIPSGRWSLESAMKLILAVFVLLPLLTAMVVTNRNKPAEIRSAMGRKAGGIAEDAKSRVCSRMQIYAEMLASVVSAELQLYPSRYCILPLMDHSGDKYIPGLENLEIVKKDGTVIYDYLYRGYDASEYPRLISLAEKGGVAFSDIRHGVSIKEKYFSLAVPLSRKDLFLIASLSPDIFKNEFCRKHYGRMFIKIQDSRGNPVTGNSEEPLPPDLIPGKHPDILFHKNNTSAMTRWSDAFWQTRKSVSAQNQWAVTVLLPLGDSIIAMQNDYVRQLIIIFSVAVTALLLSSHTASLLGRSIVELTEVVGKLSESTSRSDVSWPDSSVSEIFFLIRQFRILLDEVNRRQEELRWITADLELRVQERTEDLQKALIETEKAREWIDGILKSVGEGIIVTDLQNCVTLMNPAAEK